VRMGRKEKDREGKRKADLGRWACPAAALPYIKYMHNDEQIVKKGREEEGRPGKMGLPGTGSTICQIHGLETLVSGMYCCTSSEKVSRKADLGRWACPAAALPCI